MTSGGAFAAAESVKVNNVSDAADAVLWFDDVDEFSLAPSFVAPAEGLTIAQAQALLAASNAVTDSGLIASHYGETLPTQGAPFTFPGMEHGYSHEASQYSVCSIGRRGTMGIIRSLLKVMATA